MSLPSTNTNGITISTPGAIPTPPTGYVTYFFNSSDGNRLYYKDAAGISYLASESPDGIDTCVCCILKDTARTWNMALLAGTITPVEYATILTAGFQVSVAGTVYSISNKV